MCQILKPAAENLVYHHRLDDGDALDDIALDLGRYLNKDKKQGTGKLPDPGSVSGIPLNVEAASTPLQIHDSSHPDILTARLKMMRMRGKYIHSREQTVLALIRRSPRSLNLLW
jgi:hypothetical protein